MQTFAPTHSIFSSNRTIIVVLVLLGSAMILTNRYFPAVDDECAIIDSAAKPVLDTLRLYVNGTGDHQHPPLYDLILHGWLRLTGGEIHLLRVPAIAFYLSGGWALAAAAKQLGGEYSQAWIYILMALWPYGFHFGRLAAWYSFCFLLVSLLTWVYLRYIERPSLARWAWVLLCALLLVYSNYLGWALLGLLALDLTVRDRRSLVLHWKRLVGGGLLILFAYLPMTVAFVYVIHGDLQPAHSPLAALLTGIYSLYSIFVSESVAPWFWRLGIPAGISIAIGLAAVVWCCPWRAKLFLFYFSSLLSGMTLLGIVTNKRLLLIAPWLILPIGVTLGALPAICSARRVCMLSLAVLAGIGWYGIFARNLYAAPHWVEPWDEVAQQAASIARSGGIVIGNNPSFFFYLTYSLPEERQTGPKPYFPGLLPESSRRPGVYDLEQWLAEGRPLGPTVLLVEGMPYGDALEETEQSLNSRCVLKAAKKMVHDPGAIWKQRFAPGTGQIPWRIQLSAYTCSPGNERNTP